MRQAPETGIWQQNDCVRSRAIGAFLLFLFAAASASAQQIGWPRTIESNGQRIEIFQPQVQRWKNGNLDACAAVNLPSPETNTPVYGVVCFSARTSVNEQQREVTLYDLTVTKAEFPSDGLAESSYAATARQFIRQWTFTTALDRVLADLANTQSQSAGGAQLNSTPPRIFIRENPSVLILIDGQPVLRQVRGTSLQRVINTPAVIAFDSSTGTYYLRGEGYWMTARALSGPWSRATSVPASLDAILEGESAAAPSPTPGAVPEVIVSTEPAELVQFQGRPLFAPISGTQLLYVTNTDSDFFLQVHDRRYYLQLSGRWFRSQSLNGPWEFVPGAHLPPDFALIPPDHQKAGVLASVPGTQQAKEAIAAAQVPQTATVNRQQATFNATYDGDPKFAPIEGTDLTYAVNSPDDIIRSGGRYYAVSNGVWFVADRPEGPWVVCDQVPQEIYSIPPSSPVYPVTYVYVYDSTPQYVYVGYTPGYFGVYVWDGVVVYGTGYPYSCWAGLYYYGCPWTWGFGFAYAYWGGGFYWRPWYHHGWYWHHWHGEHAARGSWDRRILYNRSAQGVPHDARMGSRSVYNRWNSRAVTSHPPLSLRQPPGRGAPVRITPQRHVPGAPDVYAGRDGNVYMHRSDGWYRRDGAKWARVPSAPRSAPRTGIHTPPARGPSGRPSTAPPPSRPSAPSAPRSAPPRTAPMPRPSAPRAGPRHGSQATLQQLNQQRQARSQGQNLVRQFRSHPAAAARPSGRPRG